MIIFCRMPNGQGDIDKAENRIFKEQGTPLSQQKPNRTSLIIYHLSNIIFFPPVFQL